MAESGQLAQFSACYISTRRGAGRARTDAAEVVDPGELAASRDPRVVTAWRDCTRCAQCARVDATLFFHNPV